MTTVQAPLSSLFDDSHYAWDLLDWEIKIQMAESVSGHDISHLLYLYMNGVQKMNSKMDPRQAYFRNRVTALMGKPNVIKSINNNPMAKKKNSLTEQVSPQTKKQNELKEKKKQMEMRLAYNDGPEAMIKIIDEQVDKQQSIQAKINGIMNDHEEKLQERIKQRKLRTTTGKTCSEFFTTDFEGLQGDPNYNMDSRGNEKFSFVEKKSLESFEKKQRENQRFKSLGCKEQRSQDIFRGRKLPGEFNFLSRHM